MYLSELWDGIGGWGAQGRASCLPTSGVTPRGSQTTVPRKTKTTGEAIMVGDTGPAGSVT